MLHNKVSEIEIPSYVADIHDLDVNTKLLLCASRGIAECVNDILASGDERLDLNSEDKRGMTALHFASYSGFQSIVRMLVSDQRTDINRLDKLGRHAILLAWERSNAEIVDLISRAISSRYNIERRHDSIDFIRHMILSGAGDPFGGMQSLDYLTHFAVKVDMQDVANMQLSESNRKLQ